MDKLVKNYRKIITKIKSFYSKTNLMFIKIYSIIFSLFSITTLSNNPSFTANRFYQLKLVIRHKIVLLFEVIFIIYFLNNLFHDVGHYNVFIYFGRGGKLFNIVENWRF